MKKLLVLSLVLGITSLASAGLSFDLSDLNNVKLLETGGVEVTSTPMILSITGSLVMDFSGAVTQPAAAAADVIYVLPSWDTAGSASAAGDYFVDGLIPGYPVPAYDLGYVIITGMKYVSGVGNIEVYATEDYETVGQLLTPLLIPEPATMVFLGMGTLILYRKK